MTKGKIQNKEAKKNNKILRLNRKEQRKKETNKMNTSKNINNDPPISTKKEIIKLNENEKHNRDIKDHIEKQNDNNDNGDNKRNSNGDTPSSYNEFGSICEREEEELSSDYGDRENNKLFEFLKYNKELKYLYKFSDYSTFRYKCYKDSKINKTYIERTIDLLKIGLKYVEKNISNRILLPLKFEKYFNLRKYKDELNKYANKYQYKKRYKKLPFNSFREFFQRIGLTHSIYFDDDEEIFWLLFSLPEDYKVIFTNLFTSSHLCKHGNTCICLTFSLISNYITTLLRIGPQKYFERIKNIDI